MRSLHHPCLDPSTDKDSSVALTQLMYRTLARFLKESDDGSTRKWEVADGRGGVKPRPTTSASAGAGPGTVAGDDAPVADVDGTGGSESLEVDQDAMDGDDMSSSSESDEEEFRERQVDDSFRGCLVDESAVVADGDGLVDSDESEGGPLPSKGSNGKRRIESDSEDEDGSPDEGSAPKVLRPHRSLTLNRALLTI